MAFSLPIYRKPNFDALELKNAPDARWAYAPKDGVAPEGFHSTSMYPEYFKLDGVWRLAPESRMDASVVWREDGRLDVVENRNLKQGDHVILGRTAHIVDRDMDFFIVGGFVEKVQVELAYELRQGDRIRRRHRRFLSFRFRAHTAGRRAAKPQ